MSTQAEFINVDNLKDIPEEDREFIVTCFKKFQAAYEKSSFVAQPMCDSYGGFSYSRVYYCILGKIFIIKPPTAAAKLCGYVYLAFLFQIIDNPGQILGGPCCEISIEEFDKKYVKDGLTYHEYDGRETYDISKEKFMYKLIGRELVNLSDEELGKLVRSEMGQSPKEYNGEWDSYLSQEEKSRCKAIFNRWFEGQ